MLLMEKYDSGYVERETTSADNLKIGKERENSYRKIQMKGMHEHMEA